MPKNRTTCGVTCKPVHESQNRWGEGNALRSSPSVRWRTVNFLFFQIFVCLAILTIAPNSWAALTSMSVDASGDSIFRGGSDQVLIVFTVDDRTDDEDGDPYTITVDERLITQGTVMPDETVRVLWNGTINGELLPDGEYTIKVALNRAPNGQVGESSADIEKQATVILDKTPPRIAAIVAGATPLNEGSYINEPISAITVTPDSGGGSPIEFNQVLSHIVLTDDRGTALAGALSYLNDELTYTLNDPIDAPAENGVYTLAVQLSDIARNIFETEIQFVFDNVAPQLVGVATSQGALVPGTGIRSDVAYVEASFTDNLTDGLDSTASTIRITGPSGNILGQQTEPASNRIRWEFLSALSPIDGQQDGLYTIEVLGMDRAGNQTETIQVTFLYDNLAPKLVSLQLAETEEALNPISETYYNRPITGVIATFDDQGGTGVNYSRGTDITEITFSGPNANALAGRTLSDTSANTLTYALDTPILNVDGSQDGRYTLNVVATDILGNTQTATYQIVYDTQHPAFVSAVPTENETVSSLSEVAVTLSEETSGIDFLLSTFQLMRDDVEVPVNVASNGTDTVTLTLAAPIALDGSDDGAYVIQVSPTDRAGNTGVAVSRRFYLVSQRHQPDIRLTLPETPRINDLTTVAVEITGYVGAGIDLDVSALSVRNAEGTILQPAEIERDAATNLLTWHAATPVPRDGSADGEYGITALFVDFTGRRFTQEFSIVLDTEIPALVSTVPTENETVSSLSEVEVTLSEETSGIDFLLSTFQLMRDDVEVPVNVASNGTDTVTLTLAAPIALDGSDDGAYVIQVSPTDRAGNTGVAVSRRFYLVSQRHQPDIRLTLPETLRSSDLTTVSVELTGYVGAGIDFDASTLEVRNAEGSLIPQSESQHDEANSVLMWEVANPFISDGSADGEYSITATFVDFTGKTFEKEYTFVLDTQAPPVESVEIAAEFKTHPDEPHNLYITEPVTQATVVFGETADDVDFDATLVSLVGPNGNDIPISKVKDGQTVLTLHFQALTDSGEYVLSLTPRDRLGNEGNTLYRRFIHDTEEPQITGPTPLVLNQQPVTYIGGSVRDVTFTFTVEDVGPAGLLLTEQRVEVLNADGENVPVALTYDELSSQVHLALSSALPRDGSADGEYTLQIALVDKAGNSAEAVHTLVYDSQPPQLTAALINTAAPIELLPNTAVSVFEPINRITLQFEEATRMDFENTEVTLVGAEAATGSGASNTWSIPITLEDDGMSEMTVNFLEWEQSGSYTLTVTPRDIAGNVTTTYREFIYDTDAPEIIASDPLDLSQPFTYMSESFTQFNFTISDIGPTELVLADQRISIQDADGNRLPTQLTHDTVNRLFLTVEEPLPLDGSRDGNYTVVIELVDAVGNPYRVEHLIVYDTQAPTVTGTVPADGALLTADVTEIEVQLNDEGGSGVDWSLTTVTLLAPSGAEISGEMVSNGAGTLTMTTNQLVDDGRYIIQVQAADRAGNGGAIVTERSFLLSRRLPALVSTEPITAPEDEAFTNAPFESVEARIETDDENHLSTLRLLSPANLVLAGQQRRVASGLVYDLARPLATDGSEDGVYTIEFTPISASGRSGSVQQLTFTYDTQAPDIEIDDALSLVVVEPEVNNSLTALRVSLTDETSGIDWENLDADWFTFERISPEPTEISGRVSEDGEGTLTFRLAVPLADNGSADGEYRVTVNPKDRAENDDAAYEKVFTYDTRPPMIDSSALFINDAPLLVDINADAYPTAVATTGGVVVQANIFDTGLGVNLAQSRIVVRAPDGSELSGNTQQNGVDTLIFRSDGLRSQGVYQVEVMSVGNDSELLGFAPTDSLTTEFLYETTVPTAAVTSDGGETELTDTALPLAGTATDPSGTQRIGEAEVPVPASGVWLVEIVGTGPDNQPIDPVSAVDDSSAEQDPWSAWSVDYLPTRSGEYDLDVRVTDTAGNSEVYDIGTYTMSVSLTFRGTTFGWPNPLRHSKGDVAFFSFDVNVPLGETIELTLSIYDWGGDMVLSQTYPDVASGQRNDQLVKWNLENQAGVPVARGLYIFRLEAVNAAGNRANVVGKVLVVD